ncbi:DUF87 domain-containing protein [Sphaerisporangium sp. TRM90804]|uniref:helicase HerA domain-containing protein n=1 Tax=Sphaerisporangium sp. TRM90804 TaxID=3031113 RepID=UPI002446ED98|nr:DUF87 domain-containing protein [Sphaerisporangium sp. TRM90804]MDH2427259.1 DUF87 domain-containing protein [Sphaerisporangium sp. TRM90804]
MNGERRKALEALRFNYAQVPDDVWHPPQFHVESLHRDTARMILAGLAEAHDSRAASPIGVVVQGQRGSGKTHMLGWVREKTQQQGGYFFLVSLLDARGFWDSVLVSMLDSLSRRQEGETQLKVLLRNLSQLIGVPRLVRRAVIGDAPLSREALDTFIEALRRHDGQVGRDSQDTARALVLRACDDLGAQDVGDSYLASVPEEEPGERARWGVRRERRTPQEIVRDLSRLVALTGPSVIAVDQIDPLITQASHSTVRDTGQEWREKLAVEQVAGGLMSLREYTRRTLTVLSCLPTTWIMLSTVATDTMRDRFRQAPHLKPIPDAEVGRALVEKRFKARFDEIGFRPPHPTWPVRPSAFQAAPEFTPRQLLMAIDDHVRSCLLNDDVTELERLGATPSTSRAPTPSDASPGDLGVLDARFAALKETAEVSGALDPAAEDAVMPSLLSAGLDAWILERGEAGRAFRRDAAPSSKPPVHARLRRTLDEATEDEAHWCFRAISAVHAGAALNRLRTACVAAGLAADAPGRRLFVLRNGSWSRGPRTREAFEAFQEAGGRVLPVSPDDLGSLAALRALLAEEPPGLQAWLLARRPAHRIGLLARALGDLGRQGPDAPGRPDAGPRHAAPGREPGARVDGRLPGEVDGRNPGEADGHPLGEVDGRPPGELEPRPRAGGRRPAAAPAGVVAEGAPVLGIGRTVDGDRPVTVPLEALRKHTAIFAGSGSGKTVLIRRIVEECALLGVSSIVLDPNNDLARLGEAWPQEPPAWGEGDPAKARDYLANTDVVIWTPGRDSGRPLGFQPLPDFAGVADDLDEFGEAVDAAVASLAPRAKLMAQTHKAHQGRAVLREAVTYYGRRGGSGIEGFIGLLRALPDGVSRLLNAERMAADTAENLTAAMVNDPLFGGGTPVSPGLLLTPPGGKRARVSVISFVGLASDEQRQSFVNQLQMALFAWIRRNPVGDRPLGGLFVMDEAQTFAPSGAMTACTRSTLALASQARKYGLGLVFATQAPKGLHNRIPGNAATQFFGLLNSPIQIAAAQEMARAKGSEVPDVGRLDSGRFYAALDGGGFEKVRTPLCLSHHPRSPLTTEAVVGRARESLGGMSP